MKAPKNFYNTVDQRKLGLEDGLLPDVTAADNGKILKVTEGKWGKGDDTHTETPLIVTITEDPEYTSIYNRYSADVTHDNIVTAINSGRNVLATFDGRKYVYTGTDRPSAYERITFTMLRADTPEQINAYTFSITEDEVVIYSQHALREELPTVDSEDNGKILSVVDGVWNAANPPTELPAVTSADNGKVLGVVSGEWDKMDLPVDDSKKFLEISFNSDATTTIDDYTDGSYKITVVGTINTVIDENNNDIKSNFMNRSVGVKVLPNTILRLKNVLYSNLVFAIANYSAFNRMFSSFRFSVSNQVFPCIVIFDTTTGEMKMGFAKLDSWTTANDNTVTVKFTFYSSDFEITTP